MNKIDDFLIEIPKIEKIINYTFKNKDLLIHSFIHPSYNNNNNPNYERLEFLGDSIINFHTTSWLYKNKKEFKPGQLTIRRAQIINNNLLSSVIKLLKLNDYILVGKNVDINDYQQQLTSNLNGDYWFNGDEIQIILQMCIILLFSFLIFLQRKSSSDKSPIKPVIGFPIL